MIDIRDEHPSDVAAIREVNRLAFSQDEEGRIVDALRANGAATLSLVAIADDVVVGHIMFSPLFVGAEQGAGWGRWLWFPAINDMELAAASWRPASSACVARAARSSWSLDIRRSTRASGFGQRQAMG